MNVFELNAKLEKDPHAVKSITIEMGDGTVLRASRPFFVGGELKDDVQIGDYPPSQWTNWKTVSVLRRHEMSIVLRFRLLQDEGGHFVFVTRPIPLLDRLVMKAARRTTEIGIKFGLVKLRPPAVKEPDTFLEDTEDTFEDEEYEQRD